MKAIIYGSGQTGIQIKKNIENKIEIIGFLDGNSEKWGGYADGIQILGDAKCLNEINYDVVYIGTIFWEEVRNILLESGVSEEKIVVDLPRELGSPVRNTWLSCYSKLFEDKKYAVAEGGVYRGEFSAVINECFPNSKLYLFDTFEGFDSRDLDGEYSSTERGVNDRAVLDFSDTSLDIVVSKLKFPELAEVHKGYFPESAKSVDDTFMFVNLDFDLYKPILEGLRFFWPKMVNGAALLVHDYYHIKFKVSDAIKDYEKEIGRDILKMPIGDNQSIALIKTLE